jgi:hypothetical protein
MTPELAQLTYSILGRALESYTKDYGKNRLPEKVMEQGAIVAPASEATETGPNTTT